jgi:hypothetical protein
VAVAGQGGSVVVTLMAPGPAALSSPQVLPGPARALAYGVDLNADGYGDLLVGRDDAVDVYYGSETGVTLVQTLRGSGLGAPLSGVGDVNGDGFADVVIGRAGGPALFLSGRRGLGSSSGAALPGDHVAAAGDVDADGYADVVVCAPAAGQAWLYRGGPSGLKVSGALPDPRGAGAGSFGQACAGVGDVNGDGFGDVLVIGADQQLRAFLYLGGDRGLTTASATLDVGAAAGRAADQTTIAIAGDINADDFADVLITNGAARLYLGGLGGLATTPLGTLEADLGVAAGLGDLDGDGFPEAVLAPRGCDQSIRIVKLLPSGFGAPVLTFAAVAPLCPRTLLAW